MVLGEGVRQISTVRVRDTVTRVAIPSLRSGLLTLARLGFAAPIGDYSKGMPMAQH